MVFLRKLGKTNNMLKPIVLSGIQPTGNLHIGNYMGAVQNWVALQNAEKYQCYFCIVDYHSLTSELTPAERKNNTLSLAAELIAAGLDPKKITLFVQSQVPEHTELAWIFNCVTPVAELYRMTQFKDKSTRQEKNINTGLLTYPILQAADILLYGGQLVPVGQDQVQHLELTKDIARWFNNRFGNYFPEVKPLLTEIPKVMSLLEPTKKMSKSLGGGHIVELADEPKSIEKKLSKAVTATAGGGTAPGAQNLLMLLKQFGTTELYTQFLQQEKTGTIRYGDLKKELARVIGNYFSDFRKRRAELLLNTTELQNILDHGAQKAQAVAQKTMSEVRKLIGIR